MSAVMKCNKNISEHAVKLYSMSVNSLEQMSGGYRIKHCARSSITHGTKDITSCF